MKKLFYFLMMNFWADKAIKYCDPRFSSEKQEAANARCTFYSQKFKSVLTKSK